MRPLPLWSAGFALATLACASTDTPTSPAAVGTSSPLAALGAPNTWTPRAPTPFSDHIFGYSLGAAPNSSGRWIVYTFGGTSDEEPLSGVAIRAYNVATNTWTSRSSRVFAFNTNGVGKIGSRLYFSGGTDRGSGELAFSRQLWAYDYGNDRLIQRAPLPIFSAEGVTGVINGKLYVLPGACSGDLYPNPGYCAEEATRRFYRYDPATNTWVSRRQAPHFHRQGAAGVINGKLYVAGGLGASFQQLGDLDVYDPATNTWSTLAPLPRGGSASGAVLQGQFYVVVRHIVNDAFEFHTYAYSPATNRWRAKARPDFAGDVVRVALDGQARLFMAGGSRSALYTP